VKESVEQVVVANDEMELVVLPGAGARLHSLRFRGHDVLRTPGDPAQHEREPFLWGGYVMAPWCNRITPAPMRVGSRVVDLAPNFPDGTAIHGEVYNAPWQQVGATAFTVERDGEGWPWPYRAEIDYALDGRHVAITLRLHNLSEEAMPGGIGLHPWFPTPVEVRIDSGLTYGSNNDTHVEPRPVSGDLDLRARQAMREGVDSTWAQPADPPVELWWRAHGVHAVMRAPFPTLHITAAYAPERGAIAVEPQNHAPQGLRRFIDGQPGALTPIAPGAALTLPITLDFDTAA